MYINWLIKSKTDVIESFKVYGITALLIMSFIEMIFFTSLPNFIGCVVSIYAWLLMSHHVLSLQNLRLYLLPTIAVSGYVVCYYFLPLLVTLLEFKPLTYNFQVPMDTFWNMALNVSTIILAYKLCISLYSQNNWLVKIWTKIGYFTPPSDNTIWTIGIVGFVLVFISMWNQYLNLSEYDYNDISTSASVSDVIVTFFKKYSIVPLVLLFGEFYRRKNKKHVNLYVFIFLILLAVVGIATTRRAMVFTTFATMAVIWLLRQTLQNKLALKSKDLVGLFLGLYLITGPLADLAAAMVINRSNIRSGGTTFEAIMQIYDNREKLHKLVSLQRSMTGNGGNNKLSWSEYYVDNIFFDRICNIRVLDASVFYAQQLGYNNSEMHQYFINGIINRLPSPIVSLIDAKKVPQTTVADVMNNKYFGNSFVGWKVTGDIGAGLYMFGYFYYPIALIIYVMAFYIMCTFTKYKMGILIVPVPVMIALLHYIMYFDNAYGIFSSIGLIMRSWVEILEYCTIVYAINSLTKHL